MSWIGNSEENMDLSYIYLAVHIVSVIDLSELFLCTS